MASVLGQIVPLVILFAFLGGFAFVGYYIYLSVTQIGETATERMNRKNLVFSREGMRVGVKDMGDEKYVDKTQKWVVKAWKMSGKAPEEQQEKERRQKE